MELASASAALKATRPGGRAGIPSLAAVERLIQDR
jgi:sugar/nucleoside kinase (ribokinase family)